MHHVDGLAEDRRAAVVGASGGDGAPVVASAPVAGDYAVLPVFGGVGDGGRRKCHGHERHANKSFGFHESSLEDVSMAAALDERRVSEAAVEITGVHKRRTRSPCLAQAPRPSMS